MEISLLLKIAGVSMLVAVTYQILQRTGREEQALLISLTGVIFILLILVGEIGDLLNKIRGIFGIGKLLLRFAGLEFSLLLLYP